MWKFKSVVLLTIVCLLFTNEAKAQYTFSTTYPYKISGRPMSYQQPDGYLTLTNSKLGSDYKVLMIKTDLKGETQWTKWISYGESSARFVRERDESGNIFIFHSNTCIKIDTSGNVIWNQSYNNEVERMVYRNGFLRTLNYENSNFYMHEIDAISGLEINVYLVSPRTETACEDWPCSIAVKDNDEISITIAQQYCLEPHSVWGTKVFTKLPGSDVFTSSDIDLNDPEQINLVMNIQYVGDELWGVTDSSPWTDTHYFVRFNTSGEIYSQLPVYTGESLLLTIKDFVVNNDQNTALLCEKYYDYTNKETLLFFLSPDDSLTSVQSLPLPKLDIITNCSDDGYLVSGSYTPTGTYVSYLYLHKTDSMGLLTAVPTIVSHNTVHVYPNPARGMITIKIQSMKDDIVAIYDIFGRLIIQVSLQNGEAHWNATEVKSGVYFYSVNGATGKIIIE